jgi:hypothetical protein
VSDDEFASLPSPTPQEVVVEYRRGLLVIDEQLERHIRRCSTGAQLPLVSANCTMADNRLVVHLSCVRIRRWLVGRGARTEWRVRRASRRCLRDVRELAVAVDPHDQGGERRKGRNDNDKDSRGS